MNAKTLSMLALMSCLTLSCGKDNTTSSAKNKNNGYDYNASVSGSGVARKFPNTAMTSYNTLDKLIRAIDVLPSYHLTKINDEKVVSSQPIQKQKLFNFNFTFNFGQNNQYQDQLGETHFVSKISGDQVFIVKQGNSETVFRKDQLIKMLKDISAPKDYVFVRTEIIPSRVCYNGQQLNAVEVRHLFSKTSTTKIRYQTYKVKSHLVSINLPLFANPIMTYDDANQVQRYMTEFNNQVIGCR